MKTKAIISALIVVLLTISSSLAQQQEYSSRFGFELNTGASFVTHNVANADLNIGGGFEAILHYRFMPHTGVYAGWGWNKNASTNESFAGQNMDFEETGYIVGLQYIHPLANYPVSWYVRAAGLYNHIEIENSNGDIVEDTGHGLGWQVAGGFSIPMSSKWELNPGVKFNALSRELTTNGATHNLDLNYLSMRVGIVRSF